MRLPRNQLYPRKVVRVAALVLLASTIVGWLLIDRCPLSARSPDVARIFSHWRTYPSAPEILFLGSSRTGMLVDPLETMSLTRKIAGEDSPRVYDASIPAGEPITMQFIAKGLVDQGRLPTLVVLEISPDTVCRRNHLLYFAIRRQFTTRDMLVHFDDLFRANTSTRADLCSSRLIPFWYYRSELRSWLEQKWLPLAGTDEATELPQADEYQGFRWSDSPRKDGTGPPPPALVEGRLRPLRRYLARYEVAGKTPEALEHVVALFAQRGVPVILFQPPLHSAHRALFSPEIVSRFRAFVEHLTQTYGCRVVDFSDRLPDAMFWDNEHANSDGRAAMSRILAEEVLAPAWREEMRKKQ